jgi:flagellar M-ring protein FliF
VEAPKSIDDAVSQAGTILRGLSPKQRVFLIGGIALVALTLWGFVELLDKPKYSTLYSGLKPADAQALGARLAAKNIQYELSPDGTSVLVPADQLDASRVETASQGLPRNARLGFEIFDTPNWTGSDFTEKVNYQRALEGELERTLQTLSEVEGVRVHLVFPRESLFSEQEREAKAAVLLKTRGGTLSERTQLAIPQLVASAVDGLLPENVTVVDADSNTPLLHSRGRNGEASGSDLEQQLEKAVLRTLEPVVGADHARASVHVDYDLSTSEDTDEIYDPTKSALMTQQKSEDNAGGAMPAGVPGTASNLPGASANNSPGTAAAAGNPPGTTASNPAGATPSKPVAVVAVNNDSQSSHSESETYAVSKSIRHSMQPAGRIKRITAAILVDDAVAGDAKHPSRQKRTAEELTQIEQLAAAAIGIDSQRGDLISVENLSFQEIPVEKVVPPTKLETTRRIVVEWLGLLRYAGILALFLIVYFLMLRPVKRQFLTAFRELPGRILAANKAAVTAAVEIELPAGSEQSRHAAALKKQLTDKVKSEPEAASRLVQGWIRETAKS